MQIQLTKDKSINVNIPFLDGGGAGGGAKRRQGPSDLVGVDLRFDDPRGCPAVRLVRKKDKLHVLAVGFVPPPDGDIPSSWEELPKQPTWTLPADFQSTAAAIAASSADMFLRQTTPDALTANSMTAPKAALEQPGRKKIGLRSAKQETAPATAESAGSGGKAIKPEAGVPLSNNGTRFVVQPLADESFIVESGMPEYQVLWLSRLLPEGKRPTAVSIQTLNAALLSSVFCQPDFVEAGGDAIVLFMTRESVFFAGYQEGRLLLLRECPGAHGYVAMREAVKSRLGLEEAMVDSVLNESLIDPTPVLEPFARPILQQLEISMDYLLRRHSLRISKVLLMGLPSGAQYWSNMSLEALKVPLITPSAFAGLGDLSKGRTQMDDGQSQVFLGAIGAAIAAMEVGE